MTSMYISKLCEYREGECSCHELGMTGCNVSVIESLVIVETVVVA